MDPVIDATLRVALALLFLVAAAHKARDARAFRATLAEYRLLPDGLVPLGAVVLTAAELGVAFALGVTRTAGLLGTGALLVLYAVAVAINLARGRRHIDCGCAGPAARRPISGWLVGRNLALALIALAAVVPVRPRPLVWIDALTAVGATAVLVALYASVDRMLADAPALARVRGEA